MRDTGPRATDSDHGTREPGHREEREPHHGQTTGASELSLKRLAVVGAAWILGATALRHVLKLASSLILTRVLFPEAFGQVATAALLTAGVEMCSDFGIRQAIVQNQNGGTRRYINVAWTIIAVRGVALGVVVALLAWPFASFFDDPQLFGIVLLVAFGPILQGVCSPGRLVWARDVRQDRISQLELIVDAFRLVASICGALIFRNAFGLAVAGLSTELVRVAVSYWMYPVRPTISWDASISRDLVRYGRFVFLSSLLGFFALRLDSFFIAKFLGMEMAGIYYIALALASPMEAIGSQLIAGILFPALARRQSEPGLVRHRMRQVTRIMILGVLPLTVGMATAAPLIVSLMFDSRYASAATAFRWLVISAFFSCLGSALNARLMASGRPQWGSAATAMRLAVFCLAAYFLGGLGIGGYAASIGLSSIAFAATIAIAPHETSDPAASRS